MCLSLWGLDWMRDTANGLAGHAEESLVNQFRLTIGDRYWRISEDIRLFG